MNAPRRLVIAGGVGGDGTPLGAEPLRVSYRPASLAWEAMDAAKAMTLLESTDPAEVLRPSSDPRIGTTRTFVTGPGRAR